MRRHAGVAAAVLAVGLLFVGSRLAVTRVQSPFEAAILLEQAARQGEGKVTVCMEDVDFAEVYTALESIYPYAFSLHSRAWPNGVEILQVEVAHPARQQQAEAYAEQLARSLITPDMDDRQKLRALHDGLVRMCVYDTETYEAGYRDGVTAPFAADGALLDHRAVCAGYGRAYSMLCRAVGLHAVYITSDQMGHGWNAVRLDGQTYYIDCTFDDPVPDGGEYVTDTYFLLTAEELMRTHQWDRAFFEQALDSIMQGN